MKSTKGIISCIEESLNFEYVSEINKGHNLSRVLKFKDKMNDSTHFIAKLDENGQTKSDIDDNIYAYGKISKIGMRNYIPCYFSKTILGTKVLFTNFEKNGFISEVNKSRNSDTYKIVKDGIKEIVKMTLQKDSENRIGQNSIDETLSYISLYSSRIEKIFSVNFPKMLRETKIHSHSQNISFFLLDFTPDNIFLNSQRIVFIDPWKQKSYLGQTAISIGQFVTLCNDVYRLPYSNEGSKILRDYLFGEFSEEMGCSILETEKMFILGKILQFTLSSYVRKDSDLKKAKRFANQASVSLSRLNEL